MMTAVVVDLVEIRARREQEQRERAAEAEFVRALEAAEFEHAREVLLGVLEALGEDAQ